ncbi:MAG: hypothetical protein E7184_00800 [Erysipelotrichaceae bacterium]|nr:hypothetical protein [Erysipelotrichaceae bacterium]
MQKKITKVQIKKYLTIIKKSKKKHFTVSNLSKSIGINEAYLREELAFFDPLVRLMEDYNLNDLIKDMETFIDKPMVSRTKSTVKYASVLDFVIKNMTSNGDLIDKYTKLSKTQLKDLEILVRREIRKTK